MEYIKLGKSGLDVSKLCLGCMSFGDSSTGWLHDKWVLNQEDTNDIIKTALKLGINFFDTANIYSNGTSEEYIGKALKNYSNRDRVVIATKVFGRMHTGPNGQGLSRKHILAECEKSLKRLQTDYIDLYIIHRYDYETPIEETLSALTSLVRDGKVRYIGASSMFAWQFLQMIHSSEKHNFEKFISMQNHYNLIYREEEREMLPLCENIGVGVTPYSPLAAGRLSRNITDITNRKSNDTTVSGKYDNTLDIDTPIIERVHKIANNHGTTATQIALSWLLSKKSVNSPIIGTTKTEQLSDAIKAVKLKLSKDEIQYLEEKYKPHEVVGVR